MSANDAAQATESLTASLDRASHRAALAVRNLNKNIREALQDIEKCDSEQANTSGQVFTYEISHTDRELFAKKIMTHLGFIAQWWEDCNRSEFDAAGLQREVWLLRELACLLSVKLTSEAAKTIRVVMGEDVI